MCFKSSISDVQCEQCNGFRPLRFDLWNAPASRANKLLTFSITFDLRIPKLTEPNCVQYYLHYVYHLHMYFHSSGTKAWCQIWSQFLDYTHGTCNEGLTCLHLSISIGILIKSHQYSLIAWLYIHTHMMHMCDPRCDTHAVDHTQLIVDADHAMYICMGLSKSLRFAGSGWHFAVNSSPHHCCALCACSSGIHHLCLNAWDAFMTEIPPLSCLSSRYLQHEASSWALVRYLKHVGTLLFKARASALSLEWGIFVSQAPSGSRRVAFDLRLGWR